MPTQAQSVPNFEAIRTLARKYARIFGLNKEDAKDVSHDVVQWYLENPLTAFKRNVYHVTVDAIRDRHGGRNTPKPELVGLGTVAEQRATFETNYHYLQYLTPGIERTAFVLTHKWGMTQDEVAEALGITKLEVARALTIATSDIERGIKGP